MPPKKSNLLKDRFPGIYDTFSRELNRDIDPDTITYGSGKKVWWECSETRCGHHIWQLSVSNRVNAKYFCPFCSGKRICECNSLFTNKELMVEWDQKKNDKEGLDPKSLARKSSKRAYWICSKGDCDHHRWSAPISDRARGHGCPYCSHNRTCKCTSICSREDLIREWDHKKNKKFGLYPKTISTHSSQRAYWICSKSDCGHHKWAAIISSRSQGLNCPYCSNKKICPCNSLFGLFPDLEKEWDWEENDNLGLNPWKISAGSSQKAYWICSTSDCGHHKWSSVIKTRTRGGKCPYCTNNKCCPCKSFLNLDPHLAKKYDWDRNQDVNPYKISLFSSIKLWWKCKRNDNHVWFSPVRDQTFTVTDCPLCYNSVLEFKCEKILDKIKSHYSVEFSRQYKFDDCCGDGAVLRFDFCISGFEKLALIELDGLQHFVDVLFDGKTSNLKKVQRYDKIKRDFAEQEELHFLHISYSELKNIEEHLIEFFGYIIELEVDNEGPVVQYKGKEYPDIIL